MNSLRILLLLLCSSAAMAQKALPAESIRPLAVLVDSLSYVEVLDLEISYKLQYNADSGQIGVIMERFYCGTWKKTPVQYFAWFRLSDIDPYTVEIEEKQNEFGLRFFAANNNYIIESLMYMDGEPHVQTTSDRAIWGFWTKDADRELLLKIKEELIRLIRLCWEGKVPEYQTDIDQEPRLIMNGEEVIWQNGN